MTSKEPTQDLSKLMDYADEHNIVYSPDISEADLVSKINDFKKLQREEETKVAVSESIEKTKKVKQTASKQDTVNKARKLRRVRITCMDPSKSEYTGELFCVGNSVVGTYKRFVPFETDWHIENIIYGHIKESKYQSFRVIKNKGVPDVVQSFLVPTYNIADLPDLTEKELKDLAQRQAMAKGTEENNNK